MAAAKLAPAIADAMGIKLAPYQIEAIDKLRSGSILCGGVGSGKSRTSLAYYFMKECGGRLKINGSGTYSEMTDPKDLYIITTAKKRDTLEWELECAPFALSKDRGASVSNVRVIVDSWNNISKYSGVKDAFFIFDEQRVVGSGAWTKSFLEITKKNKWILLTATPGDTWSDYVPVFIANGFYKHRTAFFREHAVYSRFAKYPKVERYIETAKLLRFKEQITVKMKDTRKTKTVDKLISVEYDEALFQKVWTERWNPFLNRPIKQVGEMFYLARKVVNMHPSRIRAIREIFKTQKRLIVFYNFDYELEILRTLSDLAPLAEWNGHKHETIPKTASWIYLVQYAAGAEGWNCIDTDTTAFYSMNYSYKAMVQAAGRIDRVNTPYDFLYYYHLRSKSAIDMAIGRSLRTKKSFNEKKYLEESSSRPKHML